MSKNNITAAPAENEQRLINGRKPIDFVGKRKIFFSISIGIIILGIISYLMYFIIEKIEIYIKNKRS